MSHLAQFPPDSVFFTQITMKAARIKVRSSASSRLQRISKAEQVSSLTCQTLRAV
jgi:hypothetical protein